MIDITKPNISKVTKGLDGKIILVYGTNDTGKTLNAVKAEKPFYIGFENGLQDIPGVPYHLVKDWDEFLQLTQQFITLPSARDMYKTLIIDTVDNMGNLAADKVCELYKITRIKDGNNGFGHWKEYENEITRPLKKLIASGYTIIFLGHADTKAKQKDIKGKNREKKDIEGNLITQIYPFGEPRVLKPIIDSCYLVGYCDLPGTDENGNVLNSTLYLRGSSDTFFASCGNNYIIDEITEWTMEKLEKAIGDAITQKEKSEGIKAVDFTEVKKEQEEASKSKWHDTPFEALVEITAERAGILVEKFGGHESIEAQNRYVAFIGSACGNPEFKLGMATPSQRKIVESILDALIEAGC